MRLLTWVTLLCAASGIAQAQTVIVNDDFESYASDADFWAVWEPRNGPGDMPAAGNMDQGIIDDGTLNPNAYPGDGMGGLQGIDHIGGAINQHVDLNPSTTIFPSETQSIFLSADIYDAAQGNKRMSVGLRNRTNTSNLLELGFWNANTCDPTQAGCDPSAPPTSEDPTFIPGTGYGYRMLLFNGFGGDLMVQPNWQYFQLPIELDREDDLDEIVSVADIGAGWHRFAAEITATEVTVTLDLFRDGINNGTGEEGVDASHTWVLDSTQTGFDSLRIGGPSGVTSAGGGVVFDNILLELRDVEPGDGVLGDYNEDGVVNAADYVVFRNNLDQNVTLPNENPAATTPGLVDAEDYAFWVSNFGNTSGGGASVVVPEPASILLVTLSLVSSVVAVRRRVRH